MATTISGLTGISNIQNGAVTAAKLADGAVTPVKTQVGSLPSMVRLNTANGYGSVNTMIRRFTNIVTNQGTDITYADSATLGSSFTINTNGVYAISYSDNFNTSTWAGLTLNTSQPTTTIYLTPTSEILAIGVGTNSTSTQIFVSWTGHLVAGSVVRPHTHGSATGNQGNGIQFTITRVA